MKLLIKEKIQENIIITDGAMGTYYSQLTGKETTFSEKANKENPQIIEKIHKQYIKAGADLIRTNTFSANTVSLGISRDDLKNIIISGYKLAQKAVRQIAEKDNILIAADIGPIPEIENKEIREREILQEYKYIIDCFYSTGARLFLFETFSDLYYLKKLISYIDNKNEECDIIVQFAVNENGYTRKNISTERIIKEIRDYERVVACGFNCGVGPTHLKKIVKELTENIDLRETVLSALPNAGYPEIIKERTVYTKNAEYFAEIMQDIKEMGVKIIGGCCGTTPLHIKEICKKINQESVKITIPKKSDTIITQLSYEKKSTENKFKKKLKDNEFVIAVELDPPFSTDIDKLMKGAQILKDFGIDIITIADSPLGRERIDSMMMAAKIKREIGIETMPHLTCRDINIIGLKSKLMAGYIDGIRNLLLVTGDPIPSNDRNEIKSVFNLNSYRLMELVKELNQEKFENNDYFYGGALNLNIKNLNKEVKRMEKKLEQGANYFLTQPIYNQKAINHLIKVSKNYNTYILGGIMPPVSYRNARFLDNEIPGINIPDKYINKFKKEMPEEEAKKTGIRIALDIAKKIKKYVNGYYLITPLGRVEIIKEVIKDL